MESLRRKSDVVVNVALTIAACLLSAVLIKMLFVGNTPGQRIPAEAPGIKGRHLSIPDLDWSTSKQTLVLVLQTRCHFCNESAPFYQRIARGRVSAKELRLLAVLPESPPEAQRFLGTIGIQVDEVRQSPPAALGVTGTPTMMLVDNSGVVTEAWVGKLSSDKESEIITKLKPSCCE